MDVSIEDLIGRRKDLFKQVEAIDIVLKLYGHKAEDYLFDNKTKYTINLIDSKIFPIGARLEKQILWLFENELTKALKLTELQQLFNKHIGHTNIKIDNKARTMKKEGKLVFVKYNDKNIYSFWGLPSWIEGEDFSEQFRPSEDILPEVKSSKVIRDEDENIK